MLCVFWDEDSFCENGSLGMGLLMSFWRSLQYQNRKAEYFSAIWDVVNWKAAEKRFEA